MVVAVKRGKWFISNWVQLGYWHCNSYTMNWQNPSLMGALTPSTHNPITLTPLHASDSLTFPKGPSC